MKVSTCARKVGLSYKTAWRWFKAGKLAGYQADTGPVIVTGPLMRPFQLPVIKRLGFRTGDIVQAVVPAGKKAGKHLGRVAIRASGSFRIGKVDGINWRYCRLIHASDGYDYKEAAPFLPGLKPLGFQAQAL